MKTAAVAFKVTRSEGHFFLLLFLKRKKTHLYFLLFFTEANWCFFYLARNSYYRSIVLLEIEEKRESVILIQMAFNFQQWKYQIYV